MLWLGISIIVLAICIIWGFCETAHAADECSDKMYEAMHRGDDNGNDQDLQ